MVPAQVSGFVPEEERGTALGMARARTRGAVARVRRCSGERQRGDRTAQVNLLGATVSTLLSPVFGAVSDHTNSRCGGGALAPAHGDATAQTRVCVRTRGWRVGG